MTRRELWGKLQGGTRLRLTHTPLGPANEVQKVMAKRGNILVCVDHRKRIVKLRVDKDTRIDPVQNGFRVYVATGYLEYRFAQYTDEDLKLREWDW